VLNVQPQRQTHFGKLLAQKMRLVATAFVVLCDRLHILTAQV